MTGMRACVLFLLMVCGVGCSGCSPLYVLRGAVAQGKILLSREPVERVAHSPRTSDAERAKLELLLDVRRFAADDLGMDVGDAYSTFARVPPGALVWVVSAARQTKLESRTWWFPIVGHVTYKGFFEKSDAEALAARLEAEGWDTWVRPSGAFSTLGWFDDPILSNWLTRDDIALADLLIHELLHRSFYLPGQTDFNESFASWVGHAGAVAYFEARDGADSGTAEDARARMARALAASARFEEAVAELRALYARAAREDWPRERILKERSSIFALLGPPERINNAVILARWAYRRDLRGLACAAREVGGSLRAQISAIEETASGRDDPFAAFSCPPEAEAEPGPGPRPGPRN